MHYWMVRLMILAALFELGFSVNGYAFCYNRECSSRLEKASRDILKIDWKPISVFPEEGQRFR